MPRARLPLALAASLLAACAATQTNAPAPDSERPAQVAAVTAPPPAASSSLSSLDKPPQESDGDAGLDDDDTEEGEDREATIGALLGGEIGEAYGFGGLGLVGTGSGDADGGGIGLGSIGTLGHGSGTGTGSGYGTGSGRLGGSRDGRPTVATGASTTQGKLPPEVVRRIVHRNVPRIKYCYERKLAQSPNLAGRLSVRFIIGRDGRVSSVANAGSDLADQEVISCVLNAFRSMSFPQPDGGIVVVTYPFIFRQGDSGSAPADAGPPPSDGGAAPEAGR